jgi:hypothetical protein
LDSVEVFDIGLFGPPSIRRQREVSIGVGLGRPIGIQRAPFDRRVLLVALGSSELAGIAETRRVEVVIIVARRAGTIRSASVLLAVGDTLMKRLLAAALILSALTDFASAQAPADDAQDKTRMKPGPYPTEFQISGTAGGTDGAFLLDNKARLFFCVVSVGSDTLECTQPVQLPEQVIVAPNHTPRAAKYFMAQIHQPASGMVIVSNYGLVRRCDAKSGPGGLELSCSSPVSLP